jgi:hypothetical protein
VGGPAGSGRPRRALWIALAVGACVRLLLLRLPRLWYDEATTGLLGLAVLGGELPIYFFGQPFMGALDGYLAAPLYWMLGVSARSLELVPVLLSLAGLALTVRLAQDAFGPRAALLTAGLLAVPPDFLLFWSHEARGHYPLTVVLGTLALLLALRAPAAPPRRGALLCALLGGALGLAFWTNFLSLVYYPAIAVVLARRGLRPLVPAAFAMVPAFALGSLPHWLYGVPHGTALPPPGRPIGIQTVVTHLGFFGGTAWPVVAGVPESLRTGLAGAAVALALGALYLAAAGTALNAMRRAPAPAGAVGLALVVLVCTNIGVAVATQYGRGLNDRDPHYLLPLYTALPPLLGAMLAKLPHLGASVATTAVVMLHAVGALEGSFRSLRPAVAATERAEIAAYQETLARLERAGLDRGYDADPSSRILTFLAAGRVVFAHPYEEIRPRFARAVDGAAAPVWWTPHRSLVLEANLAAVGLRFSFEGLSSRGGVYRGFTLTAPPVRELEPTTLRVSASPESGPGGRMTDRVAGTLWSTGRPQRGGERIAIDLGTIVPVALVRWLPGTYQEVPRGVRLEASADGTTWRTLLELPEYVGPLYWSAGRPMTRVRSGRVELRVPPVRARHIRITQTGQDAVWAWTVRELYVYAAQEDAPARTAEADDPALARAVRAAGVARLYADHGWASRVALADPAIRIPPANLQLDDYGFKGSARMLLPPLRWEPGTGVLLERGDAESFAAAARAAGLLFEAHPVGALTLFAHVTAPPPGPPLPAGALSVTASRHTRHARLAVDRDPATRWATAGPRAAGDWFRVDASAAGTMSGVRLTAGNPADLPPALVVEGSRDGARWERLPARVWFEREHRWAGFGVLADGASALRVDFSPIALTALRLTLPGGDPTFDWSIQELTIYGGE